MQNKNIKKIIVFSIISTLILIASVPAFNTANVKTNSDKNKIFNNLTKNSLDRSWYWKESYPNYSPNGTPDFDQKQNAWKTIEPGENGVIDSIPAPPDDFINPDENRLVPGPNCQLETVPQGDDLAVWSFCGPVAVANCFWWIDSRYANQDGIPGDGEDEFSLVEDYGVGDDHLPENVPLLIEILAKEMKTSYKGTTYTDDMEDAINQWFVDNNLDDSFAVTKVNKPDFYNIDEEFKQSLAVVLQIGFFNEIGDDCIHIADHYVTCAGVNSEELKIAISDPFLDEENPAGGTTEHNDPQNVSHDIYDVEIGCPCQYLDYLWWLPNYPTDYNFTVVQQAIIIYPIENEKPAVTIEQPESYIYILSDPKIPFFIPIIIGNLFEIKVSAYDNLSGIDRVEFYINDEIKKTDDREEYDYVWSIPKTGIFWIKVVAYDNAGNFEIDNVGVLAFVR